MLPHNLVKSRKLCAEYVRDHLNLSAFLSPVQYVKFTTSIQGSDREVIVKITGDEPEILEYQHKVQINICNRFSDTRDTKDFHVSFDSEESFISVSSSWDGDNISGIMTLTPLVVEENKTQEDIPEVIEVVKDNTINSDILEEIESTEEFTEETSQPQEVIEISIPSPIESSSSSVQYTSTKKDLKVVIVTKNSEGLVIKVDIDIFPVELLGIIKPWLVATDKLAEFRKELKETKHNAICLYLHPAYEWDIRKIERSQEDTLQDIFLEQTKEIRELNGWSEYSDELFTWLFNNWRQEEYNQALAIKFSVLNNGEFHLKTNESKKVVYNPVKINVMSQYIAPIRNRAGSVEERKKKEARELLGDLFGLTPILVESCYLAQSYILFDPNTHEFTREIRNIALQVDGKFYYCKDLTPEARDEHNIQPLVSDVPGKIIFPDLSIDRIRFETLDSDNNTLMVESYEKHGIWIPKDSITEVDLQWVTRSPITKEPVKLLKRLNTPVDFIGFTHPNIKPKESIRDDDGKIKVKKKSEVIKLKKARITNLADARLVATNSLEWVGFVSNVPCLVTLVNSHDHWQLEALPIKEIPIYPLLYCLTNKSIEKYWQIRDVEEQIIDPLDKEMARLEEVANKTRSPELLEKIGRRETELQRLRKSALNREKLDQKVVAECTEIVKQAILKADYRPNITDPYYSRYILGQVYFLQQNEKGMTYLLDDHMSHKRVPTQVISAIRWLNLLPNNLRDKFPKNKPTIKELKDFIYPKWNAKFTKEYKDLGLDIREEKGKIYFDVIHQNKVQVTQLLTCKMPVAEGKNNGKVSTKVATTINFSERSVFEKFLRSRDGRFVREAQETLEHLVNIFLSRSFTKLVGENKVGKQKKVSEIIGFERSKLGWSQIKNNFVKYLTPFSAESSKNIKKGELIFLSTLKTLTIADLEALIIKIAENWNKWHRKDQEYIELGNQQVKNLDPQALVWMLTAKILTGNYNIDQIAWKHTLNWIAEVTELPNDTVKKSIGFRAANGVILTPDCIYVSHPEKWMHRIKIQLVDILLDSNAGNVEAWLQKDINFLYSAIEKKELTYNSDIQKHLEAMHDALNISLDVEASKL